MKYFIGIFFSLSIIIVVCLVDLRTLWKTICLSSAIPRVYWKCNFPSELVIFVGTWSELRLSFRPMWWKFIYFPADCEIQSSRSVLRNYHFIFSRNISTAWYSNLYYRCFSMTGQCVGNLLVDFSSHSQTIRSAFTMNTTAADGCSATVL